MTVLGSIFGGTYLATRGGGDKKKQQGPPINAGSKDEEQFIQCVYPFAFIISKLLSSLGPMLWIIAKWMEMLTFDLLYHVGTS